MFVSLKPLRDRKLSADEVIGRLRSELAAVPGATLFLQAVGDLGTGGRSGNAQYQYTLQGSTSAELNEWTPQIVAALQTVPTLADVSSDQQNKGLQANVIIDRDTASRLGITVGQIDNTLYDAFGQRQVSTIYVARNQYHVIMEVAPKYWQNPQTLKEVYVSHIGRIGQRFANDQCRGRDRGVLDAGRVGQFGQFGRGQCRPQSRDQLDRRHRQRRIVDRDGGLTGQETMIPLSSRRPVRDRARHRLWSTIRGFWSRTRSRSICRPASR